MNRKQRRAAEKLDRSASQTTTSPQLARDVTIAVEHCPKPDTLPAADLEGVAAHPRSGSCLKHQGPGEHKSGTQLDQQYPVDVDQIEELKKAVNLRNESKLDAAAQAFRRILSADPAHGHRQAPELDTNRGCAADKLEHVRQGSTTLAPVQSSVQSALAWRAGGGPIGQLRPPAQKMAVPDNWKQVRLVTLAPPGYLHSRVFSDLISTFRHGLLALGIQVEVRTNEFAKQGINIAFGTHLVQTASIAAIIPDNTVVVNLARSESLNLAANPVYAGLLGRLVVWDHSPQNIATLRAATGNQNIHRIGIGYVPELTRILPAPQQQTDVLLHGKLDEGGRTILDGLQQAGLRVRHLFNVYGGELDRAIADAKVVLSLHCHEGDIREIALAATLLANSKAVVVECGENLQIDDDIGRALVAVPHCELVETCIGLVRDDLRRHDVERNGFDLFSRRSQAAVLAQAIADTSPPLPLWINLGSGKSWSPKYLNIDIDPKWQPDLLADITDQEWLSRPFMSARFGLQRLSPENFEAIVTADVLEHIIDLPKFMTSCLALLKYGGKMIINVPYDLSYGAWQDPTHVRAFNERSWLYYTDWHWYLGWVEARFAVESIEMVLSPLGRQLQASLPPEQLYRQPRAVDSMKVVLVKQRLTAEEHAAALKYMRGPNRVAVPSARQQNIC